MGRVRQYSETVRPICFDVTKDTARRFLDQNGKNKDAATWLVELSEVPGPEETAQINT